MKRCDRPIGLTGRTCILHPDHAGSCEGVIPAAYKEEMSKPNYNAQAERDIGMLAFTFGVLLKDYSLGHFQSKNHIDEAIEMHIQRLSLNVPPYQLMILKKIVFEYFNK